MANIKISALPAISSLTGTEAFPVVQSGTTSQITSANLQAYLSTDTYVRNHANAAFNTANAAFIQANTPSYTANSAASYANSSFLTANSAASYANAAFATANNSTDLWVRGQANNAYNAANSAGSYANSAFAIANNNVGVNTTQNTNITVASTYANAAFIQANTPSYTANSAASYANSAFSKANNALANTTGTFSGDLTTTGNVSVGGDLAVNGNITYNGATVTTGTITADYIQAEKSADQTFVSKNADINWNVTTASSGITLASNTFSLKAGKTYILQADLSVNTFSSVTAYLWWSWVDASTNAQLDTSNGSALATGSSGVAIPTTWVGSNDNFAGTARLIYTPASDQTVKLRATDGSGSCTVGAIGTKVTITQINPSFAFSNQVAVGGNLTVGGNLAVTGTVTGSNLTSKNTSSWTVATGTNTYSITVPASGTYQIWVRGNITNGIIVYQATVVVTNTNVPVVGTQYAWVYNGGGTPIDFTSIPNQLTGTANTIVRSSTSPSATTNKFDFGINNTSGSSQTVYWGYVTLG